MRLVLQAKVCLKCGGIAQLVEHRPFKPLVAGSIPAAPTIIKKEIEMPRQIINEQRLISRINEKLDRGDNCRDHTVSGVMRVEKDNSGCNWSISVMSCFGPFSSAGNREAESVIKSMQSLYNLREGSVIRPIQFAGASKAGSSA